MPIVNDLKFQSKISRLALLIEQQQIQELRRHKPVCRTDLRNCKTQTKWGRKYVTIEICFCCRYMIEIATGEIFGIRGHGKVHRDYCFGTLDTIEDYWWGEYHAVPAPDPRRIMP